MTRFPYDHETCPNCLDAETRGTKGMVCQSCGHDYAPDATAQDPPELESPSGEMTPREQALVAVYVAMEEYNASRDDREPKVMIPPSLRETIVDAAMAVVPAPPVTEDTSDGYHTFAELYEHRHALWCTLARHLPGAWKSRAHHPAQGTCYPGMFITGADLPEIGQVSYHLPEEWWDACPGVVLPHAPLWDGSSPSDVVSRLTAYAALTTQAALPVRWCCSDPVPRDARNVGAAALEVLNSQWDDNTGCEHVNGLADLRASALIEHENCYPTAWWPGRKAVAASVIRGLLESGWALTPPGDTQ